MKVLSTGGRTYEIDGDGFLVDYRDWTPDFARACARTVGIVGGLSSSHWELIRFVQDFFHAHGRCPLVFETCRAHSMGLGELRRLFPTGYLRGVCKLAGLSHRHAWVPPVLCHRFVGVEEGSVGPPEPTGSTGSAVGGGNTAEKVYRVDAFGYLIDPSDWDLGFAVHKAAEIQPRVALTDVHFDLIEYLRAAARRTGRVPSIYEACDHVGIDLIDLLRLFPRGYHRGAVKIAGLRAW